MNKNENNTLATGEENIAINNQNNNEISANNGIEAAKPSLQLEGKLNDGLSDGEDERAEYNLIKTKYKDFFTEDTQKIINRRLKKYKALLSQFEEAREQEAEGVEFDGESLDSFILSREDEIKQEYQDFSLDKARENERFLKLAALSAREKGISLSDAYRLSHFEEILQIERERVREETEKNILALIGARKARPSENGLTGSKRSSAFDASTLSRTERAELAKRAAKGEKIHF